MNTVTISKCFTKENNLLLPDTINVCLKSTNKDNYYEVYYLTEDREQGDFICIASKDEILSKVSDFTWSLPRVNLEDWYYDIKFKYLPDYFNLSEEFIFKSLPSYTLKYLDYDPEDLRLGYYPSHLGMLLSILFTWCHADESLRISFYDDLIYNENFRKVFYSCFHKVGTFPELDNQKLYRCLNFSLSTPYFEKDLLPNFLENNINNKDSIFVSASSKVEPCLNPALIPNNLESPYVLQCVFEVSGELYFSRISSIYNRGEDETLIFNPRYLNLKTYRVVGNPHRFLSEELINCS